VRERHAFKELVKAEVAAAECLEDALASAEVSGATQVVRSLAAEIYRIRECIERCRQVQCVLYEEAARYLEEAERHVGGADEPSWRFRSTVCRGVASELAKALEGF
jgi:hypothetical protein